MKKCTKCNKIKELSQFHQSKIFADKHNNWCKDCMKNYHKIYAQTLRGKLKMYLNNKKWIKNNLLKSREKSNKWKRNNKDKVREYVKKYCRMKSKTDINFKILHNLRTRVIIALKGNPKLSTTMNLVGCSVEKLRIHLQKQFTNGMTWQNYGRKGWTIDHIKPCALFDLSKPKEQKKCFHYTNLQPLWYKDNCSKQDNYKEE
jgi:hypothetical protein